MFYPRPACFSIAAICLASLLAACTATVSGRDEQAATIARSASLNRMEYAAPPFTLVAWQRITNPETPVHIYIEGDGLAWLARGKPSPNPTPKNPVALKLASRDNGANVVYLARPCQFEAGGNGLCKDAAYWTTRRFSNEVIGSYMTALDTIAARTDAKEFHVTGFSGGANIAGLLAARRSDITTIRTVAGNIDNDYFTRLHKVSAMPLSLNMANVAGQIAHIPQMHFIGGKDKIVPADIYKSYALTAKNPPCIHSHTLPDATHNDGWDDAWPMLLNMPVECPEPLR